MSLRDAIRRPGRGPAPEAGGDHPGRTPRSLSHVPGTVSPYGGYPGLPGYYLTRGGEHRRGTPARKHHVRPRRESPVDPVSGWRITMTEAQAAITAGPAGDRTP
jgi:hypothetical protein